MNNRIKNIIEEGVCVIILMAVFFFFGRLSVKPKIITKIEIKEVKIYDLTQNPKVIEAYANLIGKAFVDKNEKQEIEMTRHKIWQEGWLEGFRDAKRRCK